MTAASGRVNVVKRRCTFGTCRKQATVVEVERDNWDRKNEFPRCDDHVSRYGTLLPGSVVPDAITFPSRSDIVP